MSLENLNEETHPELYARARQTLDNCDWYEDGKFRDDIPSEDLVIATMIHFRNAEVEALAKEVRQLWVENAKLKREPEWLSQALNEGDGVYRP